MHIHSFTTQGIRERNEDTIFPDAGQISTGLVIVADGLGGHADGKVASQMACDALRQIVENEDPAGFVLGGRNMPEAELMEAFLSDAVRQVGATVWHAARQNASDMGTTLLAVVIKNGHGYCAHIGDCALLVSESGQMPLIRMTSEHRRGASLTRSLGAQEQVTPDVFSFEFGENAVLVMGTDGFWEHVALERIGDWLLECPPDLVAEELVQEALTAGSQDNVSLIVVEGDGFVHLNAARQAEAYARLLDQRGATPQTASKRAALAGFSGRYLAPEPVAITAPEAPVAPPAIDLEPFLQRVKELEQELDRVNTDREGLRQSVKTYEDLLTDQKGENKNLKETLVSAEAKANENAAQVEALNHDKTLLNSDKAKLSEDLAAQQKNAKEWWQYAQGLEVEKKGFLAEIENLRGKLSERDNSPQPPQGYYTKEAYEVLLQNNNNLQTKLTRAYEQLNGVHEIEVARSNQVDPAWEQVRTLRQENEDLRKKISSIEGNQVRQPYSSNLSSAFSMEEQLTEQNKQMEALRTKNKELIAIIDQYKKQTQDYSDIDRMIAPIRKARDQFEQGQKQAQIEKQSLYNKYIRFIQEIKKIYDQNQEACDKILGPHFYDYCVRELREAERTAPIPLR